MSTVKTAEEIGKLHALCEKAFADESGYGEVHSLSDRGIYRTFRDGFFAANRVLGKELRAELAELRARAAADFRERLIVLCQPHTQSNLDRCDTPEEIIQCVVDEYETPAAVPADELDALAIRLRGPGMKDTVVTIERAVAALRARQEVEVQCISQHDERALQSESPIDFARGWNNCVAAILAAKEKGQ